MEKKAQDHFKTSQDLEIEENKGGGKRNWEVSAREDKKKPGE